MVAGFSLFRHELLGDTYSKEEHIYLLLRACGHMRSSFLWLLYQTLCHRLGDETPEPEHNGRIRTLRTRRQNALLIYV